MKFFRYDSAFWSVTSKMFDIMLLNILWFVTSIPIITIGAATKAVFAVTLKQYAGDEPSIITMYFREFIKQFKKITILWLNIIFVVMWLLFGIYVCVNYSIVFVIAEFSLLLIFMITSIYIFPISIQNDDNILNIWKLSMYTALLNLPQSIILLTCIILPIIVTLFVIKLLPIMLFLWIFFGFAGICYLQSFIMKKFSLLNT